MAKEHQKMLKRMGFPEKEIVTAPASCVTKVQTCLIRRLNLLDNVIQDVKDVEKDRSKKNKPVETIQKILRPQASVPSGD